jgi:hypothetical protein
MALSSPLVEKPFHKGRATEKREREAITIQSNGRIIDGQHRISVISRLFWRRNPNPSSPDRP